MPQHTRDSQGRQVVTMTHNQAGEEFPIPMTVTNGADYSFHGDVYRATLEEDASDTMAVFQRHPVNQVDDEPSLFLDRNDGSLCDDTGRNVGTYDELERIDTADEMAQVTANDIRALLDYSPRADATLIRWQDTGEIAIVPVILFTDISYSERDREYVTITTANDLRQQGDWDIENPTDDDFEAFAQMMNEE